MHYMNVFIFILHNIKYAALVTLSSANGPNPYSIP